METLRTENTKLKQEKAKQEACLTQLRGTIASLQQDLKFIHEEYTKLEQHFEAKLKEQEDKSNLIIQSLTEQIKSKISQPDPSPFEAVGQKKEEKVDHPNIFAVKKRTPKSKDLLLQKLEPRKAESPQKYITPIRTDSHSQPTHCSREADLSSFNESEQRRLQTIDKKNGAIDSSAFRSLALLGNYTILKDAASRLQGTSPLSAD